MCKKLVLSLLCALICVSSIGLAACDSKKDSGSAVTLKWATVVYGQKDEKKVLEEFNRRLADIMPGVTLEFIEFNPDKWTGQMAAREVIDIAWTGYSLNMDAEIQNKSYMALNDLISEEKTPNLWKEWKEVFADEYDTAVVDGRLYALPNLQPLVPESKILKIPESLFEHFDIDAFRAAADSSSTSTRELYDVLDRFFQKIYSENLVDSDTVSKYIDIKNIADYLLSRGYASIGKSGVSYKVFNSDKIELVSIVNTEEFKLFCEYAVRWYKAGYISKEVLQDTGATGSRLSPLTAHTNGVWFGLNDPERGVMEVRDADGNLEQYYVNIDPRDGSHLFRGSVSIGSQSTYLAVPFTAKNPEKSVALLDLLRSPIGTPGNDLLNLLVYGIKDEHYTLEGDLAIGNGYTLQASKSNLYGKPHWGMGNVFLTYRTPNILEGQAEYVKTAYKEKKDHAYKTPIYGFKFDSSSVQIQIGNMNSVRNEFYDRLVCGLGGDGWESLHNEYLKKLDTAGLNQVIDEIEKQISGYKPPAN
jgi:hypothetical protein